MSKLNKLPSLPNVVPVVDTVVGLLVPFSLWSPLGKETGLASLGRSALFGTLSDRVLSWIA